MRNPEQDRSGFTPSRQPRWGTLALVILLHVLALFALARALAPQFTSEALDRATSLITVEVTTPDEPEPTPEAAAPQESGPAGEEAPEAIPQEVTAPVAPLPRPNPVPVVASTGAADVSGAGVQGVGTGAGGAGEGMGAGGQGSGRGGGGARPLALISGTIDDARDYPAAGRQARRGHDVVIELTVGTNGRVISCRVTDPSPDPQADDITCRLAMERFVFRPRLDAQGRPVTGIYRWRQRWF